MANLRCRPSENEREPLLVYVSSAQLLNLKTKPGSLVEIAKSPADDAQRYPAVIWTARTDTKDGVVGISKWLQEKTAIKLGNDVIVRTISNQSLEDADIVPLVPLDKDALENVLDWQGAASIAVREGHKYLAPKQILTVSVGKLRKDLEVVSRDTDSIYKVGSGTRVQLQVEGVSDHPNSSSYSTTKEIVQPSFEMTGGLEAQIAVLRTVLEELFDPEEENDSLQKGLLLHGPAGTGKTWLRRAIEQAAPWSQVVNWRLNTKIAPTSRSTLVHIQILEKLTDAEARAVFQLFEESVEQPRLVVAEIRDANNLQDFLRVGSCFGDEVELSVPDRKQRRKILDVLAMNRSSKLPMNLLQDVADASHGYTGGDLKRLLTHLHRLQRQRRRERTCQTRATNGDDSPEQGANEHHLAPLGSRPDRESRDMQPNYDHLTADDLANALAQIRPSTLRTIILEKPSIAWSDIGGQEVFKNKLRDAVEWPLRYPEDMKSYGMANKKGILLYGPPGCSKTMLVKALATESSYNFLAVKGAELISMYVGESERATREIFRKARAARPCIVFFDEIDAIARRATGGSELNVLTTLLNELDGFEELKDVFIVAATNKPQSIDPALLRAGRFDNLLYVGLPDLETREAILKYRFERFKFCAELKNGDGAAQEYAGMMEGFSGAEVVAITQNAAELAFQDGLRPVSSGDMLAAIKSTPKSVTKAMLEEYDEWNAERLAG